MDYMDASVQTLRLPTKTQPVHPETPITAGLTRLAPSRRVWTKGLQPYVPCWPKFISS